MTSKKTALVFGHSSGLGKAISQRPSPHLVSVQADLSNEMALTDLIDTIKKNYSSFDYLIYTAGIMLGSRWGAVCYDDMELIYKVNVLAPIFLETNLINLIKSNATTVLNATSSTTARHYPRLVPYAASKAALRKFTNDLQGELQYTNARAIDFCPGGFSSSIYKTMIGEKLKRHENQLISLDDMADLALYVLDAHPTMRIDTIFVGRKKFAPDEIS